METTDGSPDKRSPRLTRKDLARTPKVWMLLAYVYPRRDSMRDVMAETMKLVYTAAALQRMDAFDADQGGLPNGEQFATEMLCEAESRLASINCVAAGVLRRLLHGQRSPALLQLRGILSALGREGNISRRPLDGAGAF